MANPQGKETQDMLKHYVKISNTITELQQLLTNNDMIDASIRHPTLNKDISMKTLIKSLRETRDNKHKISGSSQEYNKILRQDVVAELDRLLEE